MKRLPSLVGVDEVGRGALAGPLLVVAAKLKGKMPSGLTDSKLMSRVQRDEVFDLLVANFEFGEGWVTAVEIDNLGLGRSLRLGARRALSQLRVDSNDEVVMDGIVNYIPKKYINRRCGAKADLNCSVVSAASVYAKVRRDRIMTELARRHKGFSFAKHVGYGTPGHYKELQRSGPIKNIHRFSFQPVGQAGLL